MVIIEGKQNEGVVFHGFTYITGLTAILRLFSCNLFFLCLVYRSVNGRVSVLYIIPFLLCIVQLCFTNVKNLRYVTGVFISLSTVSRALITDPIVMH
ncbi:hypothetical protein RchiOBHm_Chr4g0388651 [Rosa chinensis]|uniref:Uncharacterized protein n=1 Tax=Rosa chinensis TaxID=74649 RepID=A0A2P6QPT2_ROSCH|nr:hypothetical protein RchiOBHm_Chr4g0388651 [Rosa chinensis]